VTESALSKPNWFSGRVFRDGEGPASKANIANIITVVRILFSPIFLWLLLADNGDNGPLRWIAAALFIVTIASDFVDGKLARGRNLVTNIGIILDPIADKALTGCALVGLSILGELPWWVTVVILVREFGITAYRFAVLRKRVIPASRGGKLKTWAQAVALALFLAPFWIYVGDWYTVVAIVVMAIAFVLTVYTGIDYLVQAYRAGRAAPASSASQDN
jgi:CDP-diacylglycerol---glycerol-3-phosphate 3-phosphatidyltransferase